MLCRITSPTPEVRRPATHSTRQTRNTRCEQAMKYFTPELFMQLNSLDVDEAEQADEKWQQEEAAYKERLATIRGQMPSQVVRLSELCLHDARVVSREEFIEPAGGPF